MKKFIISIILGILAFNLNAKKNRNTQNPYKVSSSNQSKNIRKKKIKNVPVAQLDRARTF